MNNALLEKCPNTGKYGPETNSYLDTFHAVMSAQPLRDNVARFCKDNLFLILINERDRNDEKPEAIHIRAIEPVRSIENVEENETMKIQRRGR